jgi:mycothione reductase
MKKFDVITIGSGGGAKISSPAAGMGYKVAVIEKDALGGTCLNRGCIPSKMLIHPADIAIAIKEAKRFDIHNDPHFTVDFAKLINRISATVDGDSAKINKSYTSHPNITFYHGAARFLENKVIEVNGEQITADKIFIAVGGRPTIPNIPGLIGTPFMTSTEALRHTTLPKSMIVIGGGYIACELGHAYGALGTKTHFLVRSSLLRAEDVETSAEFSRLFSQNHDMHFNAIPDSVEYANNRFTVHYTQNGAQHQISAEALLVSTGITSNVDTLDIMNTDIELRSGNFIKVDNHLQTTVPDIYALGDCVGNYFFRHSVNFEGEYLFDYIFGGKAKRPIHYPPVPHAIFTSPQVAGVGLTEEQAKAEGIDYVIGLNPYKSSAMGMALLSEGGFCKIIIERKTKKILGAHIVGDEASNMLHMIIAFMTKQGTLDDLLNMIYIHPALPEIVRNAARKAKTALDKNVVRV